MREVSSYDYTRLLDLRTAKSWLIPTYRDAVIMSDEFTGMCCGKMPKLVRTLTIGRLGVSNVCNECFQREVDFIAMLVDFDETEELSVYDSEVVNQVKAQNRAFEKLKKEALSKDQKRRQSLEEQGQMRLF